MVFALLCNARASPVRRNVGQLGSVWTIFSHQPPIFRFHRCLLIFPLQPFFFPPSWRLNFVLMLVFFLLAFFFSRSYSTRLSC